MEPSRIINVPVDIYRLASSLLEGVPDILEEINEEFLPGLVGISLVDVDTGYAGKAPYARVYLSIFSIDSLGNSSPCNKGGYITIVNIPVGPFAEDISIDISNQTEFEYFLREFYEGKLFLIELEIRRYLELSFKV